MAYDTYDRKERVSNIQMYRKGRRRYIPQEEEEMAMHAELQKSR
jgi:hypothetical protein